jgi:hypothetical protein
VSELRSTVALRPERALVSALARAPDLRAALRDAEPLSVASGDFDGDGMPDLVAGYSVRSGSTGLVALWRGNVDAVCGWSGAVRRRRPEGTFTEAPFLGPPAPPGYLAAGDSDCNGVKDLAIGAREGEAVFLFAGDGSGGLAESEAIASDHYRARGAFLRPHSVRCVISIRW